MKYIDRIELFREDKISDGMGSYVVQLIPIGFRYCNIYDKTSKFGDSNGILNLNTNTICELPYNELNLIDIQTIIFFKNKQYKISSIINEKEKGRGRRKLLQKLTLIRKDGI